MNYKQLVTKTVKSMRLIVKFKNGKKKLYVRRTKNRFTNTIRECPRGEYAIKIKYVGNYKNETPFYKTKQEALRATHAFLERGLLEEFVND